QEPRGSCAGKRPDHDLPQRWLRRRQSHRRVVRVAQGRRSLLCYDRGRVCSTVGPLLGEPSMRLKRPTRDAVEFAVMGGLSVLALGIGLFGYARELIQALFG